MLRIILVAVCCSLALGEPETVAVPEASPSTAPVVPVVSTAQPTFDPYLRGQFYNKEYYNKEYYNKDLYNKEYYNKDLYNKEYYNQYKGAEVPILTYTNENSGDGTYSYSFSTADGKQVQESGFLRDAFIDNAGEKQGTQVVQGSFSYTAPDGTPIQVTYVADENGFRASGAHIPGDNQAPLAPVPVPVVSSTTEKVSSVFDPNLNKYNPFDYNRNRYNNQYNQYNRPYDARYPYDNKYPYDSKFPYNSGRYNQYNNQYFNNYSPFSTPAPLVVAEAKAESS